MEKVSLRLVVERRESLIQTQLIEQEWVVGKNLRAGSDPWVDKYTAIHV